MFITKIFAPLLLLLMLLACYLLLQINSILYFRQNLHQSDFVAFHWLMYEKTQSCWYSWQQFQFVVSNCQSLEAGRIYRLIGKQQVSSANTFFQLKKLDVVSIEPIGNTNGSVIAWFLVAVQKIAKLRELFFSWLDTNMINLDQITMAALISGRSSKLPTSLRQQIEVTGTQYLFAVSGQHVSIILGLVQPLLSRFWASWRVSSQVGLVWIMAIVVGFKASIVRAAIMVTFSLFLSFFVQRKVSRWRLLFLTVLTMLLWSPWYLFDIGFQLSVVAMVGVLFSMELIESPQSFDLSALFVGHQPIDLTNLWQLKAFVASCQISLLIALITNPIIIWHFERITLLGIVVGPLVSLFIPAVLTVTPLLFLIMKVHQLSILSLPFTHMLLFCIQLPIRVVRYLLELFANYQQAIIEVPRPGYWVFALYYFVLFCMAVMVYLRIQKKREYVLIF